MSYRSQVQHSDRPSYAHGDPHEDRHADSRPRHHGGRHGPDSYDPHDPAPEEQHHRRLDGQVKRAKTKPARRLLRGGYTLGHAGRQVRLGPVAFWTVVGTLVIMAGWSIITATYFAFHDDVITRLIARQADTQSAYEDRIAEMRTQVDRVTSRQLLDQEQFEHKLEQILRRQTTLESRASALGALADPGITGSIKPGVRHAPAGELPPAQPRKAAPISDKVIFTPPPERHARLESRSPLAAETRNPGKSVDGVAGVLTRLQNSLDRVEMRQIASLNAIEETYDEKAARMRAAFSDLGLDIGKPSNAAVGGPFLPYKLPSAASPFERQLYRINIARAQVERFTKTLGSIPIRKPVIGDIDTTSGFGVRIDPFLGRPAMHAGLDFRGNIGDPIRATAAGKVISAGWSGGYGNMVEIDHGNGLFTRYGHLSQIEVRAGQTVKIGQTVGRLGTTGRSTGPHLHYETRIDGDAVDPQKFLRAGLRMGGP